MLLRMHSSLRMAAMRASIFGLLAAPQPPVEGADDRIVLRGDERRQEQGRLHRAAAAADGAMAA